MADIFISYANEDRETAARLARVLESVGWSVWWDRRIPAGRTWRSVLEEALREMRCMIVLWSKDSLESPWVAEEAEEARRLGKPLVPILMQRVEPPIGFRAIQAADLAAWDGSGEDPAMKLLIADLRALLGAPSAKRPETQKPIADRNRPTLLERLKEYWPQAAIGGAVLVALLIGWQKWQSEDRSAAQAPAETASGSKIPPARIARLTLKGERREIRPSETMRLRAVAEYSDGKKADITEGIEWSSDNTQVALVNDKGEVQGLRPGAAAIKARSGGMESSAWLVQVKPAEAKVEVGAAPQLVGVRVVANRNELFPREKISLRAQGRFSDNAEKYLSSGIQWETSDGTVASIGPGGELEALRPGKVQVVARAGELKSAPVSLVVKDSQTRTPAKTGLAAAPPAAPRSILTEALQTRIAAHLSRAKTFREQGNYAGALAELEKARAIDARNEDVRKEIEQTQRACNAEKLLGQKPNC